MQQLNIFKINIIFILMVLSSGCLKQSPAPISKWFNYSRGWYTVAKGDTLSSISRKYRKSILEIARNNSLKAPYKLKVGQKLRISNVAAANSVAKKSSGVTNKYQPRSQAKPHPKPQTKLPPKQNISLLVKENIKWGWPAKGELTGKFVQGQARQNGIIITNKLGTPVYSAADGVVIYSGDALRGYGNLIIIKHDKNYLTAYAHNQKIVVKEKQDVKLGQLIAHMGTSGTDKVKLHFEIRYHGKPLDPIKLLP